MVVSTRDPLQLVLRPTAVAQHAQRRMCRFQYGAGTVKTYISGHRYSESGDIVVCCVTGGQDATVGCYDRIFVHDGCAVVVTGDIGVLHETEEKDNRSLWHEEGWYRKRRRF